ncbi:MAG TPA: radical SAM protein, partial [Sandaracinaceae bacterium]
DNVRAIALLDDLARRFPESFEHRRLRAHGFVAFTPWTRPEQLLENARVMREVRFEELRAEAAKTRLRLYPRTPLYALAEAEGLLADSFGARGDRAAEQGYDASFAWRFADPRVEAIYAACEGLRAWSRDLDDADLLELSTRFVLRWPALADAPEVAHLPLVRALSAWRLPPRELARALGPAAVVDLELEALAAGEKRALLKEAVPAAEVAGLIRAYRAMGFAADLVERHDVDATGGVHVAGHGSAIVAVARTEADLARAIERQRARDVRAMGELMGYPRCCTEAFLAQPERRDNVENERWTLRRTGSGVVSPQLSRLGRASLVSHHPCRADCPASIAIAERALARLREASAAGAAWVEATLARPVLFLDHARAALLDGRWSGARFEVRSLEPIGPRALPVDRVAGIELARDRVSLIARDGSRRELAADRPLLVVPGEPIAPAVQASLALDAAPRWLELTPDYRCNQRCVGCGATGGGGPSLDARALVAALESGRRAGITQLWIGGGEPTLRKDLLPLVREARARGYSRVRLQTNAAMLSYPEVVRKLAEAGVTEIAASIKGPDAATHDRFARAPGSFELLCRGIENARAAGLPVEGDVLLYRSTTPLLPDIVGAFFARGVERFRVWLMAPGASDSEALAEEPRWSEVARAVSRALRLGLSLDAEHLVSLHSPPCTLDDEDSRARFFAPALGLLVHDASGRRFALESSEIEGGAWSPRCEGCALRPKCNGVRAAYLARYGDAELKPRRR